MHLSLKASLSVLGLISVNTLFLLSLPLTAIAAESNVADSNVTETENSLLTVSDCKGQMRLSQKINEAENVNLSIELNNPMQNSDKAVLTPKSDTLITKTATKEKNPLFITFNEVSSGNWNLCDENGQMLPFKTVTVISDSTQTAGLGAGVIGTSVAAAGTAAAIALGSSDAFGGSSSSDTRDGATSAAPTADTTGASSLASEPEIAAANGEDGEFADVGEPLSPSV